MESAPDPVTKDYIDGAKEAQEAGRYQEVLDICAEAEENKKSHPRLISAKSSALRALKRFDEARGLLEKSLDKYPDNPFLHYNLAVVYASKKLQVKARQEAERTLELLQGASTDEIDERHSITISGALLILRRYRDARRYLEHEIVRFPESTTLHYHLAVAFMNRNHWSKALKQTKWTSEGQKSKIKNRVIRLLLFYTIYTLTIIGFIVLFITVSKLFVYPLFVFVFFIALWSLRNMPRISRPPDRWS